MTETSDLARAGRKHLLYTKKQSTVTTSVHTGRWHQALLCDVMPRDFTDGCGGEHAVTCDEPFPSPPQGQSWRPSQAGWWCESTQSLPFRKFPSYCDFFFLSLMQPAPYIIEHPEVSGSACSYLKAELLSSDQYTDENRPYPFLLDFPLDPAQPRACREERPGARCRKCTADLIRSCQRGLAERTES